MKLQPGGRTQYTKQINKIYSLCNAYASILKKKARQKYGSLFKTGCLVRAFLRSKDMKVRQLAIKMPSGGIPSRRRG